MAYKKKEYKSSKSQEEKRKDIDLLVKQADEKIDKVFSSPNDLKVSTRQTSYCRNKR